MYDKYLGREDQDSKGIVLEKGSRNVHVSKRSKENWIFPRRIKKEMTQ